MIIMPIALITAAVLIALVKKCARIRLAAGALATATTAQLLSDSILDGKLADFSSSIANDLRIPAPSDLEYAALATLAVVTLVILLRSPRG